MADVRIFTGYEPKDLAEKDDFDLCQAVVLHRPSITSTYDSAESPLLNRIWMMSKFVLCWLQH